MEAFFLKRGVFWISLVISFNLVLSETRISEICTGPKPVIDPPHLVVQYGDPASATCSSPEHVDVMGWEATVGAKALAGPQKLVWNVSNVTDWSLGNGVKCRTHSGSVYVRVCSQNLAITIYKNPDRVTARLIDHSGALVEGEQYSLECEVQSVAPVRNLTVTWFRGDHEVEQQSNYTQFSIEGDQSKDVTVRTNLTIRASREEHQAYYSCAAKLDLNTTEAIPDTRSNIAQLEVLYRPRIVSSSQNVSLEAGDLLELHCLADAHPSPTYQWRRDNMTLENENNPTLRIESASEDQAGDYECIVNNVIGETSTKMSVDVYKTRISEICTGPKPVIDPPHLVVQYGDPASATCSSPEHVDVMGWEATVGAKALAGPQKLVWNVSNVTDWSLGNAVKCRTHSGSVYVRVCSQNLAITIYKNPDRVTARLIDHSGALVEGEQYSLECEVQSVAPVRNLTVTWFRGDQEVEQQSNYTQFSIEGDQSKDVTVRTNLTIRASREEHQAYYSCAAKLDLNTTEPIPDTRSNIAQLEVLYRPRIVSSSQNVSLEAGDLLELHCLADAHPSPTYQWRRDNMTLENENNATLRIESASEDQAGDYECIVNNVIGETSTKMSVDVYTIVNSVTVPYNQDVRFGAESSGDQRVLKVILLVIAMVMLAILTIVAYGVYHLKKRQREYN
ncbi:hypothetical protein ACEWY4_017567 [Coilia grayii]|uniref:Ig-like domain-containing protein n=1 Tax=Coilia grayii TaxID=363190 RepID=A0ABD1JKN1_9TELE